MRISTALIPGILAGSFFADLVYSKTIYDIHAVDVSGPQGLKPASNGQVLAGGLTRLQPPKPIARKMVEGKKKRANPVDSAPMAKRSAAPNVPPCGFINGFSEDSMELLGHLDGPNSMFDHSVGWPLTFLPGHDQIYDIQGDVSGFINLGIDPSIFLTTLVPDGTPFGAVWQPFTGDHSVGPFTLGKGSSNFAFLDPVPASTGPAQLSGVPNPSEPISNMDPLDPPLATESDIWSLNPVTLELAASWTNPDGSRIPVTIFFDDNFDFGSVGITGDLDAVISAAETLLTESNRVGPVSPAAIPVRLFYVPADVTECFLPSP